MERWASTSLKVVDGTIVRQLRFICILVPFKTYNRKLSGDNGTLPQANFLSRIILDNDEVLVIDGEDLKSCFHLFDLPPVWRGYLFLQSRCVPHCLAVRLTNSVGWACVVCRWGGQAPSTSYDILLEMLFSVCAASRRLWKCKAKSLPQAGMRPWCVWTVSTKYPF